MPRELFVVEHTLDEALEEGIHRPGRKDGGKFKPDASRNTGNDEWIGTENWTEMVNLARYGWPEGIKRLSDLRDELYDKIGVMLPEPTPVMDVSGYEVDTGAWVAGHPEHMVTMMDMEGVSKQLRIAVQVCNNAHVSAKAMMMRGLLAAGLVDSLEHMGHRVELDAVSFISCGRGDWTHVVHVKRANDVMDLERTVFTLAHPSMLRRLVFAVMESQSSDWRNSFGGGYGHAEDDPKRFLPDHLKPDLYIGNAEAASRSMPQMVDRVFKYMRDGGVLRDQ